MPTCRRRRRTIVSDRDVVRSALDRAAELHRRVSDDQADAVVKAATAMRTAVAGGHRVLVMGNGGSATDAQHFAAELVGRFARDRTGLPVIALTTDTAILTAVGNDFGFDEIFARQVDALGRPGDVAMGITTSGGSANVNRALVRAKAAGLTTVGLTGRDGGETARLVDIHVNVPGSTSAQVQEVHRTVLHVMCELIERPDA
jgi:D-sedoheptulose 7-phosphate isomerase